MKLSIKQSIEPLPEQIVAKTAPEPTNKDRLGMIPHCPHRECPSFDMQKGFGRILHFFSDKTKTWTCYYCRIPIIKPIWAARHPSYTFRQKRSATRSLTRDELLGMIESLDVSKRKALRDKALIALLYLTGARIEEITGMKDINGQYVVAPLKRSQIDYDFDNPSFALVKEMPVLKRRADLKVDIDKKVVLLTPKRNVPINTVFESDYWGYVQRYLNLFDSVAQHKESIGQLHEDYLFKISPEHCWRIVNKSTGMFCHLFRHTRASHLVEYYGFGDSELRTFFGWATGAMAATYVHLNVENIMKRMAK